MVTQAADNFNRADGGLGTNWTTGSGEGAPSINSNVVLWSIAGLANDQSAFWSGTLNGGGTTWNNDQYSKAAITATNSNTGGDTGGGVVVRHAAAARTYYRVTTDHNATSSWSLAKFVGGVYTLFTQAGLTWTDGDMWELDVQSTTLTLLHSGSTVTTKVDSSIASGNPGINYSSTDNGTPSLDNWEGGDFTSATVPPYVGPSNVTARVYRPVSGGYPSGYRR